MAEAFKIEEIEEKVILVGVSEQDGDDAEDSVAELAELVKTAGATVVGTMIQKRELIHPGTYIGSGKVAELKQLVEELGATGIVCDDELSPAQLRNLEDMLDTKVMDRTLIILDIFAARATTSEGKIQVELAQLKYRLSRLTGLGRSMSRLGGGIGTRGPGEKKLEIDRRLIKDRIAQLNRELKEVRQHRDITRAQREKNQMPVAAIVGYTNAGKSTLMNAMLDKIPFDNSAAVIQEADELFSNIHPDIMFEHIVASQGEGKINYDLKKIGTNGLLTDLDYYVIGEIKGDEAESFMNAVYTGHKCWTSSHGQSSTEGMNKLVDYIVRATRYDRHEVIKMLSAMKVVIFMKQYKIQEISEIRGIDENGEFIYDTIFDADHPEKAKYLEIMEKYNKEHNKEV